MGTVPDESFNPHSPLLANEFPGRGPAQHGQRRFNPHSPLLANEFFTIVAWLVLIWRFNPHSPLLANEFHLKSVLKVWLT